MEICPNCLGRVAVRNPTGKCDHLYWPDNLTPEAKRKIEQAEALSRAAAGQDASAMGKPIARIESQNRPPPDQGQGPVAF